MRITQPQTAEEWEQYYDIRYRILREPWGEPKGSECDETDQSSYNIMLRDSNDIPIAVGRLHFNSADEAQVRYMAVDTHAQGKQYGAVVLNELERYAKEQGVKSVLLEARENAIPFYERNGYHITKKSYLLFGVIQHYTMVKEV